MNNILEWDGSAQMIEETLLDVLFRLARDYNVTASIATIDDASAHVLFLSGALVKQVGGFQHGGGSLALVTPFGVMVIRKLREAPPATAVVRDGGGQIVARAKLSA